MNVATHYYSWLDNFGTGNSLVPSDNTPLPEPVFNRVLWRHMASLNRNEIMGDYVSNYIHAIVSYLYIRVNVWGHSGWLAIIVWYICDLFAEIWTIKLKHNKTSKVPRYSKSMIVAIDNLRCSFHRTKMKTNNWRAIYRKLKAVIFK